MSTPEPLERVIVRSATGQRLPSIRILPAAVRMRTELEGTKPAPSAWLLYLYIGFGGDGGRDVFGVRRATEAGLADGIGVCRSQVAELLPSLTHALTITGSRERIYAVQYQITGVEGRPAPRDIIRGLINRGCTASDALIWIHAYANADDVGDLLQIRYDNRRFAEAIGLNEDTVTASIKRLQRNELLNRADRLLTLQPWWNVVREVSEISDTDRMDVRGTPDGQRISDPGPASAPGSGGSATQETSALDRKTTRVVSEKTGTSGHKSTERGGMERGSSSLSHQDTPLGTPNDVAWSHLPVQTLITEVLPVDDQAKLAVLEVLGVDLVEGEARGGEALDATRQLTPGELHEICAVNGMRRLFDVATWIYRNRSGRAKPWKDPAFQQTVRDRARIRTWSENEWKNAFVAFRTGVRRGQSLRLDDIDAFLLAMQERGVHIEWAKHIAEHWKPWWDRQATRQSPRQDAVPAPGMPETAEPATRSVRPSGVGSASEKADTSPSEIVGEPLGQRVYEQAVVLGFNPGATPDVVSTADYKEAVAETGRRLWLDTNKNRVIRTADGRIVLQTQSPLCSRILMDRQWWPLFQQALTRLFPEAARIEMLPEPSDGPPGEHAGALTPPRPAPATHAAAVQVVERTPSDEALGVGAPA